MMSNEVVSAPVNIVILFDNADRTTLTAMDNQLKPLVTAQIATVWHRDRINPGEHADSLFDIALEHAHIVLFIMSADFIASCSDTLIARLAHWRASHVKIISVLARPCMTDISFKGVTSLPKDDCPIMEGNALNEARLFSVVKTLRLIVEEAARRRDSRKTPMIDISVMQTLAKMERERYELERELAEKREQVSNNSVASPLALRIAHLQGVLGDEPSAGITESIITASDTVERAVARLRIAARRERLLLATCVALSTLVLLLGSRLLWPHANVQIAAASPSNPVSLPQPDEPSAALTAPETLGAALPLNVPSELPNDEHHAITSGEPSLEAPIAATANPNIAPSATATTKPCRREGQICVTSYECCGKLKCNSDRLQCEEVQ